MRTLLTGSLDPPWDQHSKSLITHLWCGEITAPRCQPSKPAPINWCLTSVSLTFSLKRRQVSVNKIMSQWMSFGVSRTTVLSSSVFGLPKWISNGAMCVKLTIEMSAKSTIDNNWSESRLKSSAKVCVCVHFVWHIHTFELVLRCACYVWYIACKSSVLRFSSYPR